MLKESIDNTLEYQKLSREEMEQRGILGRLVGICADFISPTRNGRKYPEKLWENVFDDPIMKERIENGVCYGELGHPPDREETDMEKIAVCLAEVPRKGKDGKLRAVFDILNTPNGKILKSLCDYGSTLGISSRGSGDLETDFDGNESVNPDTYNCEGFDVVLIPAVKEARLQYVNESLDKKRYNKTLRDKIQEAIDKEDESHRKIMVESLDTLGIKLDESRSAGLTPEEFFSNETDVHKNLEEFYNWLIDQGCEVTKINSLYSGQTRFSVVLPTGKKDSYLIPSRPTKKQLLGTEELVTDLWNSRQPVDESLNDKPYFISDLPQEAQDELEQRAYEYYEASGYSPEEIEDLIPEFKSEKIKDMYGMQYDEPGIGFDDILDKYTKDMNESLIYVNQLSESKQRIVRNRISKLLETYNMSDAEKEQILEDAMNSKISDIADDINVKDIVNNNDKSTEETEDTAVDNNEAMLEELQHLINTNVQLEKKVTELQEKLSVSYAKEESLNEQLSNYSRVSKKLNESTKRTDVLTNTVHELNEKLKAQSNETAKAKQLAEDYKKKASLKVKNNDALNESLNSSRTKIKSLQESLNSKDAEIQKLNEQLADADKDLQLTKDNYSKKLKSITEQCDKYKHMSKRAVEKYIMSKADMLGVRPQEIQNRLNENYSFNDIDKVCEDLSEYKLNVNSLPFSLNEGHNISAIKTNAKMDPLVPRNVDDDISELDYRLAGLFK